MNILITRFPYESSFGGEEWHTVELSKSLRQKNNNVYYMGGCNVLFKEFQKEKFITKKIWGGKMPVTKTELIKFMILSPCIAIHMWMNFLYMKKKYQISHVYCLSLNEKILLTPLALLVKTKVIWVEHQQIRKWLTKSPLKVVYKHVSRYVTIVPISAYNANQLKKIGVSVKNITEIPNGVKKLGKKKVNNKHIIGTASRLIEKKGIRYVIEVAEKFNDKPEYQFKIIGTGPQETRLKEMASEKNLTNIHFYGEVSRREYENIFLTFDVLILPSIDESETFGLIAAEAMISGIPVIMTRVSGISNFLQNNKNAIIIEPENSDQMAKEINKLFSDSEFYQKISNEAEKTAEELFGWEKMINGYISIFK